MDEEDLADAAEAQKLQTSQAFAGLGSSTQEELSSGGLMGLFRAKGDTMGLKLLRKMGWKDGQGIGPKIRRTARLDTKTNAGDQTYLFAPDNAPMIQFNRKTDRKGLGHQGAAKLSALGQGHRDEEVDEAEEPQASRSGFSLASTGKKKANSRRGGIGVGVLNDDGSDEEDPYEIGPKIKYNRVIGGDKRKKAKKPTAAVNPSLGNAPVFLPKTVRVGNGLRRCNDGRLPLDGFVLAKVTEDLASLLLEYAPPAVPPGWTPAKQHGSSEVDGGSYISAADAAKASSLDPKSRAALLGEKALPGKSIFDFLSSEMRDKLAAASGKKDLPQGRGEIPEEFRLTEEEKQKKLWDQVPKLDRETAVAALSRSSGGPYADDEAKRERYKGYLESQADSSQPPPVKLKGMGDDDFLREMNEFYNCARIFKPMTGFMASRFTTAKTFIPGSGDGNQADLVSKPEPKAADPAEEAAKMGMFGAMTRTVEDFYPTRLLCKRFNVKPPAHVRPDNEPEAPATGGAGAADPWSTFESKPAPSPAAKSSEVPALPAAPPPVPEPETKVDPEKNEAVEGTAAHAEVLRAIFGDSDSE